MAGTAYTAAAVTGFAPEVMQPMQQFVHSNANFAIAGGTVLAASYGAGLVYNRIHDRLEKKPQIENLYKHSAWRKRNGESKKDYLVRVKQLRNIANAGMRVGTNHPNIATPILRSSLRTSLYDKDGRLREDKKAIGIDSRFLQTLASFRRSDYAHNRDKAVKRIDGVLRQIDGEIGRNKDRLPATKRVILTAAAALLAVNSVMPAAAQYLGPKQSVLAEPAPVERVIERDVVETAVDDTDAENEAVNPNVVEDKYVLSNYKVFEQGEELGVVGLPTVDNREFHTKQGYAWDNNPNDPEIDARTGYDHRLLDQYTDGVSNGVHYNNAAVDFNGDPIAKPILPGNKGITTIMVHNGSGGEGLDDAFRVGDPFYFKAVNGITYNYQFIDKTNMDTGLMNNANPGVGDKGDSLLAIQVCSDDRSSIVAYVGELVSITDTSGVVHPVINTTY